MAWSVAVRMGAGYRMKNSQSELNRKSLATQVYEILETQIVSGELTPGTRLAEVDLANRLSVSRSPIREAIAELERTGLAERSGPRDRRVLVPTEKLIADIYDMWVILESGQVYLSSLRAPRSDIAALRGLLAAMKIAAKKKDVRGYVARSKEFSRLLKRHCENHQLNSVVQDYEKYLKWLNALYYEGGEEISPAVDREHRKIVDKYEKKDLVGISASIQKHVYGQKGKVLAAWRARAKRLTVLESDD